MSERARLAQSAMAVWKYVVAVEDEFVRSMPLGAKVLHVDVQGGEACVWALVDPARSSEPRTFYVHGTGHPVPAGRVHLGSFMLHGGAFVGHLFEPEGGVMGHSETPRRWTLEGQKSGERVEVMPVAENEAEIAAIETKLTRQHDELMAQLADLKAKLERL